MHRAEPVLNVLRSAACGIYASGLPAVGSCSKAGSCPRPPRDITPAWALHVHCARLLLYLRSACTQSAWCVPSCTITFDG